MRIVFSVLNVWLTWLMVIISGPYIRDHNWEYVELPWASLVIFTLLWVLCLTGLAQSIFWTKLTSVKSV